MVERIPCRNLDCTNTILPATAEQTGGLCMPCVQAAAKRDREAYIQLNRRDVNEFEGITDAVEILKILHRPRPFDPLVNWIPPATPTDRLYAELSQAQQQELAIYAESLISRDRIKEAEEITLCLAAFTDDPLETCLKALVDRDIFSPSLAFSRASSDLRDQLIARIETEAEQCHQLLRALAWIGDETVVELFQGWQQSPPPWRESLYVPPQDYAYEAGWELDDNGQRRDLYFHTCTQLVSVDSAFTGQFNAIAEREDCCPWCQQSLINLVDLVPAEFGLVELGDRCDRLQVTTCDICTTYDIIFGSCDRAGRGQWSRFNAQSDDPPDDAEDWERLPNHSLVPAGRRSPLFAADQFLPTRFSQLGGHPTWIQEADYPHCPACHQTMMFLAQVDWEDVDEDGEGLLYAFVCPDCRTTATEYQQT